MVVVVVARSLAQLEKLLAVAAVAAAQGFLMSSTRQTYQPEQFQLPYPLLADPVRPEAIKVPEEPDPLVEIPPSAHLFLPVVAVVVVVVRLVQLERVAVVGVVLRDQGETVALPDHPGLVDSLERLPLAQSEAKVLLVVALPMVEMLNTAEVAVGLPQLEMLCLADQLDMEPVAVLAVAKSEPEQPE